MSTTLPIMFWSESEDYLFKVPQNFSTIDSEHFPSQNVTMDRYTPCLANFSALSSWSWIFLIAILYTFFFRYIILETGRIERKSRIMTHFYPHSTLQRALDISKPNKVTVLYRTLKITCSPKFFRNFLSQKTWKWSYFCQPGHTVGHILTDLFSHLRLQNLLISNKFVEETFLSHAEGFGFRRRIFSFSFHSESPKCAVLKYLHKC